MTAFDHTDTAEASMRIPDPNTPDIDIDDTDTDAEIVDEIDNDLNDELGAGEPFVDAVAAVEDADVAGRSLSLFEGDEGSLTYDQRRTLVFILKHRYISAEQHPAEWQCLLEAHFAIRSRLNDLFLDLHIDHGAQIALKRQAIPEGDGRFPTLLHDVAHTREETIVLVFLRERFRSERSGGADAVYVDHDELLDAVERFRPPDANDRVGDTRRVENAIASLQRSGLLLKTADEARLRVAPVIEVLMPLPRLHELLNNLWTLNGTGPADPPDDMRVPETVEPDSDDNPGLDDDLGLDADPSIALGDSG